MEKPEVYLKDILDSVEKIESYLEGFKEMDFDGNYAIQDAVMRRLEIIGKAVKHLPEESKNKYPNIPWKDIAGMRDILIHEYFLVDLRAVWDTSKDDLPILKKQIKDLLKRL